MCPIKCVFWNDTTDFRWGFSHKHEWCACFNRISEILTSRWLWWVCVRGSDSTGTRKPIGIGLRWLAKNSYFAWYESRQYFRIWGRACANSQLSLYVNILYLSYIHILYNQRALPLNAVTDMAQSISNCVVGLTQVRPKRVRRQSCFILPILAPNCDKAFVNCGNKFQYSWKCHKNVIEINHIIY